MIRQFLAGGGAAVVALFMTPIVTRVAVALDWVDLPNIRKVHRMPVPRVGGIAIAAAVYAATGVAALAGVGGAGWAGAGLLLGATLLVLGAGLVDDVRHLNPRLKLALLVLAAGAVCWAGVRVDALTWGGRSLALGAFAWPLTMGLIVTVTVSVNFIDGLDGLAGGIGLVAAGVLAVAAGVAGQAESAFVGVVLAGALAGYLPYNVHPARIFMGDCGSMFVGFVLAVFTVKASANGARPEPLVAVGLALGVPLMDTCLTMVRRGVLQRRSLFSAERGHVHHRLLDRGLSHRGVVWVLYGVTAACGAVGVLVARLQVGPVVAAAVGGALLLAVFRAAGVVRLRELIAAVRRNRLVGARASGCRHAFEESQLCLSRARTFTDWWRDACAAAGSLGLSQLSLNVKSRGGEDRVLLWTSETVRQEPFQGLRAVVPLRDRRSGDWLRLEVEADAGESLETAGTRLAYFNRLMEEFGVARLPEPRSGRVNGERRAEWAPGRGVRGPMELGPGDTEDVSTDRGVAVMRKRKRRIAIVHDFLYCYAGAERVLEQIIKLYPDADLFSLFDFLPEGQRGFIQHKKVHPSFLQHMPMARKRHRGYLPLMPLAVEQLDMSGYDVVISSSYVAAKGVLTAADQLHICYCHTPARFAWDLQHRMLSDTGMVSGVKSLLARVILHYIRGWDIRSAYGVDVFLANSNFVARRIRKVYRRASRTVYPPVDVDQFELCREKEDFYVTASRLVPYKRVDLLVQAFNAMPERKLVVIGDGPERKRLEGMAGPNVTILGHVTEERLRHYMQTARAFLFAAEEDFGIVAVEAQACGTPVIAFCKGGATETVVPGVTGLFFDEQTLERVVEAVREFESFKRSEWDPVAIRANAERFSTARFCEQFKALVESEWLAFSGERAGTQWNRGLGAGAAEGEWAGNADVQAGDPDSLPIRIAT